MTHLTQAQRDANTHEYFKGFAVEQQKRNQIRHEAIVAANPWLANVRAMQIKLQNLIII